MKKEIALMRHFEDQPNQGGDRDTDLVEVSPDEIKRISNGLVELAERNKKDAIHFITSDLKRSVKTTELIAQDIIESKTGLLTAIELDDRIRSLRHGIYNQEFGKEFAQIEKTAWEIYSKETFEIGNIAYRFGDPIESISGMKYPELSGAFSSFGENQIEFSIRIYNFILDLTRKFKAENEVIVVSSHTAPLLRICEINNIAKKVAIEDGSDKAIKPGELIQKEWNQTIEILEEISVLSNTGKVLFIDIDSINDFGPELESEIAFLRGLAEKMVR